MKDRLIRYAQLFAAFFKIEGGGFLFIAFYEFKKCGEKTFHFSIALLSH